MKGIRKDGYTIGSQSTNDLDDRKTEIKEEGNFDVAFRMVMMVVRVPHLILFN